MSVKHWVTEPHEYIEPILGAGYGGLPPKTIIQVFNETVRKHGSRNALAVKLKVNGKLSDTWKFWTYQQYWDDCVLFAKALIHLKLPNYHIINILGFNSVLNIQVYYDLCYILITYLFILFTYIL